MKKKSMKVLSLILAIVMAISLLPLAALAEETKPTRQVGVVVYGAELTTLLTDMEKGINDLQEGAANLEEGADKAKSALERLQALATDIGTKVANGSGISVPEVDVVLVDENGKEIKLEEDKTIELFTETTEIYLPFQDKVQNSILEIQGQLDALKPVLDNHGLGDVANGFNSINGQLADILTKLKTLATDLAGNLASLTGMNGALYRTYVTKDAVPVGNYTVKVKGFYDTDENGNAITRDGYVLYNDGLNEGGSGFNTFRTFDVEIKEKTLFEHDIQFVGPANGIRGEFEIPEALNGVYNAVAGTLNTLVNTLDGILKKLNGQDDSSFLGSLIGAVTDLVAKVTNTEDLVEWFRGWNMDSLQLPTAEELNLSYRFVFPGLWCAESDAGFTFKNVDVAETGLPNQTFLLVNRDETVDVLKLMLDLGKETFSAILKATFGYTDEETGKQYESMLTLYTQLVKSNDEGQISLDYDVAYNIIKNYIAVISDMKILDKVIDQDTFPAKLKYPIPAILQATSDENGLVTFSKNSNMTLTWMLDIIPQVMETVGKTDLVKDNEILKVLMEVSTYASGLIAEYGEKIINTLVYPFAQRMGLVGKKMGSGTYIMFQTKTSDEYWVNPLAYTMILTWENETWLYVTVADLGIIVPYFAEGFYDFVRNTTFAGTIDKFLSQITGKEVNVITDILTNKIDVTAETGKVLTGALTAFMGVVGFDSLGLDTIFANRSDFIAGINQYLYENGRTAQNLMIYVNNQARKAKAVYAGYLNEIDSEGNPVYWQFYNLDKSPTLTATKLIDKSTKNISAAFVNQTKSGIVSQIGSSISKVVGTVGNSIENVIHNIQTQIKSTIGAAVQSLAQRAFDGLKTAVSGFFSNLFNRANA